MPLDWELVELPGVIGYMRSVLHSPLGWLTSMVALLGTTLVLIVFLESSAHACGCAHQQGWFKKSVEETPRLVIARVGSRNTSGPDDILPFEVLHVLKGAKNPRRVESRRPKNHRTSCDPEYEPGTIILLSMTSPTEGSFACGATGELPAFLEYFPDLFPLLPRKPVTHVLSKGELRWITSETVAPYFSKAVETVLYPPLRSLSFKTENTRATVGARAADDDFEITLSISIGALRFVSGTFDREAMTFSLAFLKKGKGRILLAKKLYPWSLKPPRYRCSTADECIVSCQQGAVNKSWYEENRDSLGSCKGGCATNAATACHAGRCVTELGPKRHFVQACTEKKVKWKR